MPLSKDRWEQIRAQVRELKDLGMDTSALDRQLELFDRGALAPKGPADSPARYTMPKTSRPSARPSRLPDAEPGEPAPDEELVVGGLPRATSEDEWQVGPPSLPAGFRLMPDEVVRVCPKCHHWAVAQQRKPTPEHPKGFVVYSHGVQGRVSGYREIVAIYHCVVNGRLP